MQGLLVIFYYIDLHFVLFVTQRGHHNEEEGTSNGSVQGVARRGNSKDYNVKLHGGSQGFVIQTLELLVTFE